MGLAKGRVTVTGAGSGAVPSLANSMTLVSSVSVAGAVPNSATVPVTLTTSPEATVKELLKTNMPSEVAGSAS